MIRIATKRLFILSLIIFVLIGCTPVPYAQSEMNATSTNSNIVSDLGYPAPTYTQFPINNDPGYPVPSSAQSGLIYPDDVIIPPISKETGIVTGQLVMKDNPQTPYLATSLYLGPAVEANLPDYPPLVSLDTETDLLATQAKNGKFVFSGVKPGKYGLVIWSPYAQTMVIDPDKEGNPLIIEVAPGAIVDLGIIKIP